ncbi:MAG: DUF4292 domain-containing protein [Flavobacteriia bacterium]|nr:DUF4292 domain-containing protein [Flavobacteriia bacterium]PIV95746.1 MAG: DUF4292 domain-containing protein [Flavobacteriaceae bacterium CG17_big_fil_post_rev_8_21_14_2_50_31_13]PIX12570.1 MAG: DUF4292 domain-containing protein [Flavobacteriaceae bacterium CG_4_8_14_3_um_filter_31_8]PIY15644.1 MAG: DUF4292 domain-containing protein [Flavobacteriaceae bacterium CG_4_10_14_3_um_filter_31_253]PIZ09315.1 MAG: DUF4292 domain-containing protein [Flavobacteriaceae bacterium CG_4_10_14_0_8_um_filt
MLFSSCKTTKNMMDANAIASETSAKKVAKKHFDAHFDKKSIDAKLKVNFNNGKTNQSLTVNLLIEKDKVIYIKGTKFITVFKAKITPNSVSYYSPLAKNYFEGDFSLIEEFLGVEINFEQLQNLFLGQALQNVKKEKQQLEIVNNKYVLSPEVQPALFDIFFTINPSHFKLEEQKIVYIDKNLLLDIQYFGYHIIEKTIFPGEIKIGTKTEKSFTNIYLIYKSVVFGETLDTSFEIPNGYKRIEF